MRIRTKTIMEQMNAPRPDDVLDELERKSRFSILAEKLRRRGVESPGGLARYIGEKKYGKAEFRRLTQEGRLRAQGRGKRWFR